MRLRLLAAIALAAAAGCASMDEGTVDDHQRILVEVYATTDEVALCEIARNHLVQLLHFYFVEDKPTDKSVIHFNQLVDKYNAECQDLTGKAGHWHFK